MSATLLGIPLWHYLAVAAVSFAASIIGGLAGYGTGLLLPLALVPTVGPEPVVPIIGITAMFTNGGRVAAFWRHVEPRRALRVAIVAIPCTVLGATFYTYLSGRGVSLLLGVTLIALVPLRRVLARSRLVLGDIGLVPAAALYGALAGGTTGSGVVLISILMASGLQGSAVIATDAIISVGIGIVKTLTFGAAGALSLPLIVFAVLVGLATFPGGFVARWLALRLSVRVHDAILDGAVIVGALGLLWRGLAP
jgi:uncharacterized membrane protein YfcA